MSALLPTRMVARPWGRAVLPAPFVAPQGEVIGEVWFEPPEALDSLLVKYIFTAQNLSVQVHPSDAQVPGEGKEECWLVLDAEPGARLAIGFRREVSTEDMRVAALDGSIEDLLEWHPVQAGDFFYIPAGTVHAIGAGISLIEVQQNSDTTYRLYDYGRPRELHLDQGMAVARGEAHPAELRRKVPARGAEVLVDGPLFKFDRIEGAVPAAVAARYSGPLLVMPLSGVVAVAGEAIQPGQCALAPALSALEIANDAQLLLAQ